MRKRKVLCSVLLSVTMALGGAVTSFAAESYSTYIRSKSMKQLLIR